MNPKHETTFDIYPATKEDFEIIHTKIDDFINLELSFTGKDSEKYYVVKEGNTIIAGIDSSFYLKEVLYVRVLFVDENHRHKGLGSMLLKHVEEEAKALGAHLVHLDTFDFQAKDFYIKHGYEVFGVLDDCPRGHKRYYMKKGL